MTAPPVAPPARCVMGVVNVTPDSFSDGGRWAEPDAAVAHGARAAGRRRRPRRRRRRVHPARGHPAAGRGGAGPGGPGDRGAGRRGRVVSVDTMRAEVAAAAVAAGAAVVNDVSGGLADPEMLDVVAASGATYVAMHWRAHSADMRDFATYDGPGGVVAAVRDELAGRVDAMLAAGHRPRPDRARPRPGLRQDRRAQLGAAGGPRRARRARPPGAGRAPAASRSSARCWPTRAACRARSTSGRPRTPPWCGHLARHRVWAIRVHDVRATRDALRVADRLAQETPRD